ncbi:hypothetical protein [Aquibium microcysteis]|uniref:hypothetical protein n=1 Tax=Aquibium microcysteis TaxID=675281 RepID=UPI00165D2828|nr:hypothetical protein [Aquibium microcysteis]
MGTTRALALSLAAAIGLQAHPVSADELKIALVVAASPASDAKRIALGIGGGSIDLLAPVGKTPAAASIAADNTRYATRLTVEWKDGRAQSIPFYRYSAFADLEPLEIVFEKEARDAADGANRIFVDRNCDGRQPGSMAVAFAIIANCAPVAHYMASRLVSDTAKGTYYRALNGWFVANYYLYSGLGYGFHPFGLHEDLISQLQSLPAPGSDGKVGPINIADVQKALDEYQDEPVRKVYLVRTLVKQRRYQDAMDILVEAKRKLSEPDPQLRERARQSYATSEAHVNQLIADMKRMIP